MTYKYNFWAILILEMSHVQVRKYHQQDCVRVPVSEVFVFQIHDLEVDATEITEIALLLNNASGIEIVPCKPEESLAFLTAEMLKSASWLCMSFVFSWDRHSGAPS